MAQAAGAAEPSRAPILRISILRTLTIIDGALIVRGSRPADHWGWRTTRWPPRLKAASFRVLLPGSVRGARPTSNLWRTYEDECSAPLPSASQRKSSQHAQEGNQVLLLLRCKAD
jgi:hypothetical protein